ncbi:unnamed protein product, partial [marine sediment metagenome]
MRQILRQVSEIFATLCGAAIVIGEPAIPQVV